MMSISGEKRKGSMWCFLQVSFTESHMTEKLHYKSLRPGARHGMRKLWLVSITKPWKVTGSWVSGARVSNPPGWKKGWDMIVWDLRVKFLTYVTARDRDRRGRERCHQQLSTWRARSGAHDVRKVMYLAPLRLYSAWLRGRHTARASALNANGTSDTKAMARGFVSLYPYLWNQVQISRLVCFALHVWWVPVSRQDTFKGFLQVDRFLSQSKTWIIWRLKDGVCLAKGQRPFLLACWNKLHPAPIMNKWQQVRDALLSSIITTWFWFFFFFGVISTNIADRFHRFQ